MYIQYVFDAEDHETAVLVPIEEWKTLMNR